MAQNTESVVVKPLVFSGSLSSYPTWRQSLGLYMTFNSTKLPDDRSKVIHALSYMTEGTANVWAQAFYEEKMDAAGALTVGTWADFVIRLDATFRDANLQRKAAETLLRKGDVLVIDSGGPEGFFVEYKSLSRDADMVISDASHDAVHINSLTCLMLSDLRDRISEDGHPAVPILQGEEGQNDVFQNIPRKPTQNTPSPPSSKSPSGSFTPKPWGPPSPEGRDKRGREGLCFGCGQKGHISPNCPLKCQDIKPKMRVTVLEMTPEERAWLRPSLTKQSILPRIFKMLNSNCGTD